MLKSPDFARLWERYEVKGHTYGKKTFHHPQVGTLTLGFQAMILEGPPGQRLSTYYADPVPSGYDALVLLT
jgi:MmyB-like transcription regulator ligand binding domain